MNTDRSQGADGIREDTFLHKQLTSEILASAFRVHNSLGCGLLEKVYSRAMTWDLQLNNKQVEAEKEFNVVYQEKEVGSYFGDLVVENKVIVEVKAVERLDNIHRAQLMNYLRISGIRVGLLLNFANPKLEYERLVV